MPDLWLLLIPGLPLLAACWIAARLLLRWGRGDEAEYLTAYSVMGAGALSLLLIVVAAVQVVITGAAQQVLLLPWLHSGTYHADISFRLDGLSLSVAAVVALITLLVTRFSMNYLHREPGFQRFFMVLA